MLIYLLAAEAVSLARLAHRTIGGLFPRQSISPRVLAVACLTNSSFWWVSLLLSSLSYVTYRIYNSTGRYNAAHANNAAWLFYQIPPRCSSRLVSAQP